MRRTMLISMTVLALTAGVLAVGYVPPAQAAKPPPTGSFTLTISGSSLAFGAVDPEVDVVRPAAVDVLVSGFKAWGTLDVSFAASDFVNTNPAASTPTMPVGVMRYSVSGAATIPETPMVPAATFGSVYIDSTDITKNKWEYDYVFDFRLNVPFDYEAGTYRSTIVYTAVLR